MNQTERNLVSTICLLLIVLCVVSGYLVMERKAAKNAQTYYEQTITNLEIQAVSAQEQWQDEVETLVENYPAYNPSNATYLGIYQCTAYCAEEYKHICGTGDGITASGVKVTPGLTVAAPKDIPIGTVLYISGVGIRVVQDRGGAINGNKLDIAVDTHANALQWQGYGKHEVWVLD